MMKEKYQRLLMEKKFTLLQLAQELKNVSKACNILGYSRQHYYNIKERYCDEGESGLINRSRRPHRIPSKPSTELEKHVLEFILENPSYSYIRIADSIRIEKAIFITHSKVRGILKRYNLNHFKERLQFLEREYQKRGFVLSEEQRLALSRITEKITPSNIHAPHAGYLLAQDTFFVGYLKGVGKIYMQTVIDCSNSLAFGKLYTSKDALVAAHILQHQVLPFYRLWEIPIHAILTDNGSEYCGIEGHPYETMLWLFNIEHRRTKVKSPQTNGYVERLHQTLLKEFFQVTFRKKFYISIDELQKDLTEYLIHYNFKRAHQGYRLKGVTPAIKFYQNMRPLALPPAA